MFGWTRLTRKTSAAKPQELPAGPVGVSGRLLSPFAEDRYRVAVTPGTKIKLEVFAERLGAPDGPFRLHARAWMVVGRA